MTEKSKDDPVSLAPLTPEEALRALLAVDPDAPPAVYSAHAVQWERGWELHIDGVGVTQVDSLDDAESQVRDYLETVGAPGADSARIAISR